MKIVSVKATRKFSSVMVGNVEKDQVVNVTESVANQLIGAGVVKKVPATKATKSTKASKAPKKSTK